MDNIITNVDGVKVKVRVYDFGDEVADRYTIVYVNKNIKDGYGVVYYPVFSCSEDPFHPLGVGMDHIDTDNYGKQFKYDREYLSFMLNVFKDEYKEHIKRDGIKKAFEDYIMSVPSIFRIHIANCDIRYLLRSWGVEFDEDDDEIYILYKRIIREVFFKMCEDMKVC